MAKFTTLKSRLISLPVNDIDTDQIIPARFLKVTDKEGLGKNLFADWRYHADGSPKADFPLNRPEAKGAQVLLVGDNFGCGSSREHAPWALTSYGFKAVISTSFADIFNNNALKNHLLPVVVDGKTHRRLLEIAGDDQSAEVTIDLVEQVLILPDGERATFPIDSFSKTCLLNDTDELGYLLSMDELIGAYEKEHGVSG